ncbi:hypothetical protein [Enterococcus sp. AZ109]|uniref:hypothetical protein n=1 Tax=Enterococcus sp. AZ109 TaxID=2774634 RepID=UPI003F248D51
MIDIEVLSQLLGKIPTKLTEFGEIDKQFSNAYSEVERIVPLKIAKVVSFNNAIKKAETVLKDTNKAMGNFKEKKSSLADMLKSQSSQVKKLNRTLGVSYNSPDALTIFQDKKFKNKVDKQHKESMKLEKERLEAERRALLNIHPAISATKGTITKEEIDRIQREINAVSVKENDNLKKNNMTNELTLEVLNAINMESMEYFFDQNGNQITNFLYRNSSKYLGIEAGSALYASGKVIGGASRALPYIGIAIDTATLISEKDPNTGQKVVGHIAGNAIGSIAGTAIAGATAAPAAAYIGGIVGTAIPIPVVGTVIGVAAGTLIGFAFNKGIDYIIEKTKK